MSSENTPHDMNAQQAQTLAHDSKIKRPNLDILDISRSGGTEYYSAKRKKEKRKHILKSTAAVLASVLVLVGVVFALYVNNLSSKLNEGLDQNLKGILTQADVGEPFYMLLIGVDKSEVRTKLNGKNGDSFHNYRTDSIILARVDPRDKKLTLTSIHRDTLVDLGKHGKQKINAAYAIGGPAYATEVVSKFAGVPISHYAEIDFDGFMSLIDVLGGVEVDIPVEVKDEKYAQGHLMPGLQTLSAKDALFLARARHAYDKYGDGDLYRAANQRAIITAIVKKILASNPATMASVITQCASYVTTDLDVPAIIALATEMRGIDTANDIYSGMEPTHGKYMNGAWYEICDVPKWKAMMKRVDQGQPPYANDSDNPANKVAAQATGEKAEQTSSDSSAEEEKIELSGSVTVLNASGKKGVAGKLATTLKGAGFTARADNAKKPRKECIIIYNGSSDAKAKGVQSKIGSSFTIQQNDGSYPTSADVIVIIGSSYN